MLKSILVPLDGSTFAEQALPLALGLASRHGATLELALVQPPPMPLVLAEGAPVGDSALDEELRQLTRDYLESVATRIEERADMCPRTSFLEGPVLETLVDHVSATSPDLLVMTTHARSGLSRAWLGSVADGLVRRVARPVLLVRPIAKEHPVAEAPSFARVLIPLDGSPASEVVIEHAIDTAGTDGVEYTLLRAVSSSPVFPATPRPHRDNAPTSRVQRVSVENTVGAKADALRARGVNVKVRVPVFENPAEGILEYADEHGIDLIAMSTRGRGGLERLFLGSVADTVLREAPCPVLLLNPSRAGSEAGNMSLGKVPATSAESWT